MVIHAAALKQVPTAEYNPFEYIRTNVVGAQNVIEACLDSGVKRVVALSTDKAAAPINLYGATKLCSDKLFTAANNIKGDRDLRFSVVRYGNVMGSRGSVIPFFLERRKTGVLPITDPAMTRFNITLQEGVDMVLCALEHAQGGEIFVPKIPSYRITDLARAIGPECGHAIVGVRPGEKIHEEMITASDSFSTVDLGRYFVILPSAGLYTVETYCAQHGGKSVTAGFAYNSGSNAEFLTVEQLRALIASYVSAPAAGEPHMIPYGRQEITQDDIDAVIDVLRSDFLTQGPTVPRFEHNVASYCGAVRAVAANSATSALHIACLALGLGPEDWLWTSPISFVASANCGLYCGANVDFVDIDPTTLNMCPEALAAKLEQAEREGRLPKIVMPVHLCGQPCHMEPIHALSKKYGFSIIEDASHAIGGRYLGKPVGACTHSHITVFSFHPVKIITTGEGGVALTNDPQLARTMELLRTHGVTRDPVLMTDAPDGPWYYQQVVLGFNYRMTDIQAALGLSQLLRVDQYVARRHRLAERYDQHLAGLPIKTPWRDSQSYSALHLYVIRLSTLDCAPARRKVFESLRSQGIGVNVHYIPIHMQPYYMKIGFKPGDFPEAERYYSQAITLPMYPTMSEIQQDQVISALRAALN